MANIQYYVPGFYKHREECSLENPALTIRISLFNIVKSIHPGKNVMYEYIVKKITYILEKITYILEKMIYIVKKIAYILVKMIYFVKKIAYILEKMIYFVKKIAYIM